MVKMERMTGESETCVVTKITKSFLLIPVCLILVNFPAKNDSILVFVSGVILILLPSFNVVIVKIFFELSWLFHMLNLF